MDNFRHVSEGGDIYSNMSSDREALVEALEAIEAGSEPSAVFPLETLSRTEGQALLARLDKLDQKMVAAAPAAERPVAHHVHAIARWSV